MSVIDAKELAHICKVHNISEEDAQAALHWIANPTIRPIVGVREFIESPYYMNARKALWPGLMTEVEECCNGQYSEAVWTGSIGGGKTTAALYALAYELYVLSCYESPHELYGLDPASEIVFVFQSLRKSSAENDFARFKAMIEKAPYFLTYFQFDPSLKSQLHFPHRIIVKPVSGSTTATIGENVFGGLIDEINFMAIVEKSKLSDTGADGTYDQAKQLYNSIVARRKSRFGATTGRLPGLLCCVSSRKYPGQFTDEREEERLKQLNETGRTNIFLYDKRVWEVKEGFPTEKFPVFVGDEARKPRILKEEEVASIAENDQHLVDWIPINFKDDFERDIIRSIRDIAGKSTMARHPFIVDREAITRAARKNYVAFQRERVDFVQTQLSIVRSQIYKPELPRFFHCDLAISGDSAGFACGTVTGFKAVSSIDGVRELLPVIWIDALLEIAPPKGGEIRLGKVRDIIHALRKMGVNIRWGTFDQFQSRDSMQLLKQSGLSIGYQSIDLNTMPYDFVKNALYDDRLSFPAHPKCQKELAALEKDTKKNKIDHPANGSKDVSDSLAGVVYGLTMRREIWAQFGVQAVQLPSAIKQMMNKEKADKLNAKV
jgi:hypothetical protein